MDFKQIYSICAPYTMTSEDKMRALYNAVRYINNCAIEGSFVECGVYKGGSVMNMALTQQNYARLVHMYLYDTFEGMTAATDHDITYHGHSAAHILKNPEKKCVCSEEDVRKHVFSTGYAPEFFHFVKGDVVQTLQKVIPPKIALLRIDTDWYESTKAILEHLFPQLVKGGVMILDDYDYWRGARKAVDEYFAANNITPSFIPMGPGISGVVFFNH